MQDNVWYLCFESFFQVYKKCLIWTKCSLYTFFSNIWELDPQGNLLSGGTCSYSPLDLFPKRSWSPTGTWLVLPFYFFSLKKIPCSLGKILCLLGEVVFWGNLIPFFSKKINPITNLISFFPREVVHFLLKKLFPFSLEIFFLKRNVFWR